MVAKEGESAAGRDGGAAAQAPEALARLTANLERIDALTKRLVAALAARRGADPGLQGPGPELYVKAMAAYWTEMASNPGKLIERQAHYWGETLRHAVEAQVALRQGRPAAAPDQQPRDRRFSDPMWQEHPWYNFVKQQYQITARAIEDTVGDLDALDAADKKRVAFFSRQILDLYAPTNFLATNPEAMRRAVETEGDSLVRGLENLVRDIERNEGDWLVTLSDPDAFKLGENIATAPGQVVFRNRMFELIQYAPATEQVHRTPIVLFPPWINKFYILDLKPQNSLIRWIVEQGHTLFVVSWANPDASFRDVALEDYVRDGYLEAIRVAREVTQERQVNAVGYCIAGTTLALALAWMRRQGDKSIKSATFLTTLTDFADPGEMGVFLDDDFVGGIEREAGRKGYLDKFFMSRTFSYLRANDLIYGPAVKTYMMGEAPPAFDLLHWNGDGTNLPGPMVTEYLRRLCMGNELVTGFDFMSEHGLTLTDVAVPVCAIACETDHIAAWRSSYAGIRRMGAKDKTFVLSESGHIAGIVNPPSKKKYGHYVADGEMPDDPAAWLAGAEFHEGSWWPRWGEWLAPRAGRKVDARPPGSEDHPPLGPAPGGYVLPRRPAAAE